MSAHDKAYSWPARDAVLYIAYDAFRGHRANPMHPSGFPLGELDPITDEQFAEYVEHAKMLHSEGLVTMGDGDFVTITSKGVAAWIERRNELRREYLIPSARHEDATTEDA